METTKQYKEFVTGNEKILLDRDGYLTNDVLLNSNIIASKSYTATCPNNIVFSVVDYYSTSGYFVSYRKPETPEAIDYLAGKLSEADIEQLEAKAKLEKISDSILKAKVLIGGRTAKNATDRAMLKLEILATDGTIFEGLTETFRDYILQEALKVE